MIFECDWFDLGTIQEEQTQIGWLFGFIILFVAS